MTPNFFFMYLLKMRTIQDRKAVWSKHQISSPCIACPSSCGVGSQDTKLPPSPPLLWGAVVREENDWAGTQNDSTASSLLRIHFRLRLYVYIYIYITYITYTMSQPLRQFMNSWNHKSEIHGRQRPTSFYKRPNLPLLNVYKTFCSWPLTVMGFWCWKVLE